MSARPGIVVVGASWRSARGRSPAQGGYDGPLTLVGDEPHRPYDRPPLSKHVLAGDLAPDATALPHLVSLRARWQLGQPATGLDRARRTIRLADGGEIPYAKLLIIATGTRARPWPGPGSDLGGVFTIRSREDAAALRRALARPPKSVLVIAPD